MCLECSGKHRGLGVHISFVRSVTMDAWNELQLKKMQVGGNGKMNGFFEKYGVSKGTGIVDKYNSPAAEFYREVIKAAAEGRTYTPPDPKSVEARGRLPPPQPRVSAQSTSQNAASGQYRMEDLERSAAGKDDFFAQRQRENAMRPDHLPPSQGGKYVGFGSTPAPRPAFGAQSGRSDVTENVSSMLNKGFSELSVFAKTTASVARVKASEMNDALQEAGVAEKTKEYGQKGWSLLRSAYASAASAVEGVAKEQGIQLDLGSKKVADGVEMGGGGGRYMSVDAAPPTGHGFEGAVDTRTRIGGGGGFGGGDGFGQPQQQRMTPTQPTQPPPQQQRDLLDMEGNDGDFQDDGWADWGDDKEVQVQPVKKAGGAAKTSVVAAAGTTEGSEWTGWDDDLGAKETNRRLSAEHEREDSWGEW